MKTTRFKNLFDTTEDAEYWMWNHNRLDGSNEHWVTEVDTKTGIAYTYCFYVYEPGSFANLPSQVCFFLEEDEVEDV